MIIINELVGADGRASIPYCVNHPSSKRCKCKSWYYAVELKNGTNQSRLEALEIFFYSHDRKNKIRAYYDKFYHKGISIEIWNPRSCFYNYINSISKIEFDSQISMLNEITDLGRRMCELRAFI